jgi:hypothetical protein
MEIIINIKNMETNTTTAIIATSAKKRHGRLSLPSPNNPFSVALTIRNGDRATKEHTNKRHSVSMTNLSEYEGVLRKCLLEIHDERSYRLYALLFSPKE